MLYFSKDFPHSFSLQRLWGKWEAGKSWTTSSKTVFPIDFKHNILTHDICPKSILCEALNSLISVFGNLNFCGEFCSWPFLLLVYLKKIRATMSNITIYGNLKKILTFSDRFCGMKNLKENPGFNKNSCQHLGFLVE